MDALIALWSGAVIGTLNLVLQGIDKVAVLGKDAILALKNLVS